MDEAVGESMGLNSPTLHMAILFDFYGELLTDKQREYFDLYHNEDLSLSEIAEKAGITRNGVYDIINRAEGILIKTEAKTGIVKKWLETRKDIESIKALAEEIKQVPNDKAKILSTELIKILDNLQ